MTIFLMEGKSLKLRKKRGRKLRDKQGDKTEKNRKIQKQREREK